MMANAKRYLYVLAAGDLITTVGSSAYMIVLLLIVANYSRNVFENGLVGDVSAIPELLLGAVVGLTVDRYSRRKLMLAANMAMAAISWIPALFLHHMTVGYYVLVLADLGVQIGNLVDLSSHNAYVKYLLPDADIRWGEGILSTMTSAGFIAGLVVGIMALHRIPTSWYLIGNAVTFGLMAVTVWILPPDPRPLFHNQSSFSVTALVEGIKFFFRDNFLRYYLIQAVFSNGALSIVLALLVFFVDRQDHLMGHLLVPAIIVGISMGISGLVVSRWPSRWSSLWLIVPGRLLTVTGIVLLLAARDAWSLGLALGALFFGQNMAQSTLTSVRIRYTPLPMQGRVASVIGQLSAAAGFVGVLLVSLLGQMAHNPDLPFWVAAGLVGTGLTIFLAAYIGRRFAVVPFSSGGP